MSNFANIVKREKKNRALSRNDVNILRCREGYNVWRSPDLRGDGYGNFYWIRGDPNLLKSLIREYRLA